MGRPRFRENSDKTSSAKARVIKSLARLARIRSREKDSPRAEPSPAESSRVLARKVENSFNNFHRYHSDLTGQLSMVRFITNKQLDFLSVKRQVKNSSNYEELFKKR